MNKASAAMSSRFSWLWTATCWCKAVLFSSHDLLLKPCPFCGRIFLPEQVRRHRYEARGGWARVLDGGSDVDSAVGSIRSQGGGG